jgi:Uma2 family endonuclease
LFFLVFKNTFVKKVSMISTIAQEKTTVSKPKPPYISWSDFQRKYLTREDGYKYEWLNGTIEKTKRTMDYTQFYIAQNLRDFFEKLRFQDKAEGMLISECDVFFLEKHRRPDIAYFTAQQIYDAAEGINPTPRFVIEVISNSDAINRVNNKMQNYRAANVEIVWHIFPQSQEVQVYCGENLDTVYIKRGDMICSANPVLPDFNMTVSDIFRKQKP